MLADIDLNENCLLEGIKGALRGIVWLRDTREPF